MLTGLNVKNYILIDALDIEFPEHLVIITGQTGAGKSILLGALSLALGGKADPSAVGPTGDNCVVEASFEVEADPGLREMFQDQDLEPFDGGVWQITVRRVLSKTGRSRSFVNDEPVPVGFLQQISSRLIDIHSQHQTRILTDKAFRIDILDRFGGNTALAESCRTHWQNLLSARKEREEVLGSLRRYSAESDYTQAQLRQLDEARLRDGELEELEAEQRQLAHAEEIKEGLGRVEEMFNPSSGEVPGLDAILKDAARSVSRLSKFIPEAESLSGRIESARLELGDIIETLADINSGTELSAERLSAVEDRMSLLYSLLKKHGCQDVADLIALREKYRNATEDGSQLEERAEALSKEIAREEKAYDEVCSELHKARLAACKPFSTEIQGLLRSLELENAVFSAGISPAPDGPSGRDAVEFLFSADGSDPVDCSRCASGGEMSRIMLSLKSMMARFTDMPTLVFDEIDTGVSGSAADAMGTMICSMGSDMQVFAITHLPQVAAKGDAHYLVTKEESRTSIRRITGEDRVAEIARMLSGSKITPEAVANARALLGE